MRPGANRDVHHGAPQRIVARVAGSMTTPQISESRKGADEYAYEDRDRDCRQDHSSSEMATAPGGDPAARLRPARACLHGDAIIDRKPAASRMLMPHSSSRTDWVQVHSFAATLIAIMKTPLAQARSPC
jgi:hypothetical protein